MRKYNKRSQGEQKQALNLNGVTALYIRVSTEKQATEGNSLAAQEKQLRDYCSARGWTVDNEHVYIDAGVSGKSTQRERFQAMLQAAQDGKIQRILAAKLDRVARNVKDFLVTVETLQEYCCSLALIKESFDTSTPHGKFAVTMFAAMAELEVSMISERVSSGRKQNASEGGYNGARCPLGYIYDKANSAFRIDGSTAPIVTSAFDRFVAGVGMASIAQWLNDTGAQTSNGGKWYTSTVRYLLQNGFYAGLAQWDGVEAEGTHPAIISRETYEAAHSRLQSIRPGPKGSQ